MLILALLLATMTADGQATAAFPILEAERIDGDRPHVGTGTHVVLPGQVQIESGVQWQRLAPVWTISSPTLARIGLTDRLELRVASDGFLTRDDGSASAHGVGNLQLGTKIRLCGDRDEPWLSVMPTVSLGLASRGKQLGSGETDATATLLAGRAVGDRLHLEGNYGIGSIGDPAERFAQHLVTAAIVHQTTQSLASYVEAAWWSRQERGGGAVSFIDYGLIVALSPRILIDGGAFFGMTAATPEYGAFTGISFAVGPAARPSHRERRRF